MSKHSPAPWTSTVKDSDEYLYSPHAVIASADGHFVASVHLLPPGYGLSAEAMAEHRANIPLVEAAPALLAVAKRALNIIETLGEGDLHVAHDLRRIIAEAEGVSGE